MNVKNFIITSAAISLLALQPVFANVINTTKSTINPVDSKTSEGTIKVEFESLTKGNPYEGVKTYKYNFENGMFTIWNFEKGAFVPVHNHDTDQITHMLKGSVKIIQGSDNKEFIFSKGDTFVLPAFIFHSLEALEDAEMVGVNPATIEGNSANFKH